MKLGLTLGWRRPDDRRARGIWKRIRERYRAWADCGITGRHVATRQSAALELMAEITQP